MLLVLIYGRNCTQSRATKYFCGWRTRGGLRTQREKEREFRISQGTHAHWDPPNRLIYIEFQLYRSNNRGQPADTTALVPGGCARGVYVVYWTQ